MSKITIVDHNDTVIGVKERDSLDKNDIYRVSGLWIENSRGEALIAQRAFSKKNHPGKWGPAVAGTVEAGETYEENIIKEAEEELGINLRDYSYTLIKKHLNDGQFKHFSSLYKAIVDEDISSFIIQKDEVESIKWITKSELEKGLTENPELYIESMKNLLDTFK